MAKITLEVIADRLTELYNGFGVWLTGGGQKTQIVNESGDGVNVTENALHTVLDSGFALPLYDSVYQSIGITTKTFEFYRDSMIVATIILTYTDASKDTLEKLQKI
jgi:hypothetical protein